jgi:hypothetical protein
MRDPLVAASDPPVTPSDAPASVGVVPGAQPAHRGLGALVLVLALTFLVVIGSAAGSGSSHWATVGHPSAPLAGLSGSHPAPMVGPTPSAVPVPGLSLGIVANPHAICAYQGTSCGAGVGLSRVTMTAQASPNGLLTWPNVQVAFVVETTAYDGVYDPSAGDPGGDPCAQSGSGVCEESNGVPFFVAHSQQIAAAIQAANPHSAVSFALVDYFATLNDHDDGDGVEYHVDIPQFIAASDFGSAVQSTFQANVLGGGYIYSDSDLSDNILDSSVITAMFGTIIGSGLDWSPNTHHVIVWMGSTAPRDPNYVVDYSVSPSDYATFGFNGKYSSSCEPSYNFGTISSPQCEGWIHSQDGNSTHSIAQLAKTAPQCTDSIGGVCTVDTIDLYNGMTDPWSKAWRTGVTGGGPGGAIVQQDVAKILLAGCDMAQATGGTWDGPSFFTCPDGQQGSLNYVQFGTPSSPNTNNPGLLEAFRNIGFGPVQTTLVANGTKQPLFSFVPFGAIQMAPGNLSQVVTVCTLSSGIFWRGGTGSQARCPSQPQVFETPTGVHWYGWNWSNNASENAMYVGDTWQVSFNVLANGPPYTTVPVDACVAKPSCAIGGSTSVDGYYSAATYLPVTNHSVIQESFPLAELTVEASTGLAPPPTAPPPPPPLPPGLPIISPVGTPALVGVGIPQGVGVANAALQATAAGLLAAGFIRITQRNRPISVAVAAIAGKPGTVRSRFEGSTPSGSKDSGIGRFE